MLGLPKLRRSSFSKCLDMFLGISHGFLLKQHERHEKNQTLELTERLENSCQGRVKDHRIPLDLIRFGL